jgi:zinc transport system substrate-binding protein
MRIRPVLVLGLTAMLVGACGGQQPEARPTTPSVARPASPAEEPQQPGADGPVAGAGLTTVATIFPLAWMAEQIGPGAEVVFLGARGQDPHDLELSPGDRGTLETADVVLYPGAIGFQPQVERAVESSGGVVVSMAEAAGPGALRQLDDDHDDDDADDHADDDQTGEGVDPHVWFAPAAMARVAEAIGEAFARADPDAGQAYRSNAAALHDQLVDLDAEIDDLLSGCRLTTAIVSHEAYAYLLEPRGLQQEGISGAAGHGEASPGRLADLTERIRDERIPAVLAEPVEGRADAEALAAEAGVDLLDIEPLEVVTGEQHAIGYPTLLRQQAETFAAALDCPGALALPSSG